MIADPRQGMNLFLGKKLASRLPMPPLIERDKHPIFRCSGEEFLSLPYQPLNCHISQVAAGFSPTSPKIIGDEEAAIVYSGINFRADHSQRFDRRSKRATFPMWKTLVGLLPVLTSVC